MKAMLRQFGRAMARLHRDDDGADMVEYILIVAAVALPLMAVIIWFFKDISKFVKSLWEDIKGGSPGTDPDTF